MHQTHPSTRSSWKTRCLSLVLALSLLLGLVPGLDLGGSGSAHWADAYLSQMAEWGFVRPDQITEPNAELTRADFMAITNRAYGYSDQAPTPFEDIKETDWFYDDVEIAYTNKYIKGTSETTASPNDTLTRETAATILGRNMMMQESAGEILDFTDARDISFWSKGVIKSSLEHYLVSGYNDGSFRPQKAVTWGEMAAMLTRIVGTPLQEAGDYSLGGVFGNVTISSPGVTLRDTVISGDLYITGGVGLGDIKLENVTVLGRIICSGTGEAEGGASILLRNVTADELLIDNLQGKTVSVQADGITEIGRTTVRTSSYLEDNTPEGMGLKSISLEGRVSEDDEDADPAVLTLAGRIEEAINKTPGSTVHVAKGTVAKLAIDEAAEDSHVIIDRNAEVKELNLDTATLVEGEGDIKNLNVNAPGSEVTILPEHITIRPGITAEINGEEMDVTAAEESNREPMILSGYPVAEDVAPNSITAAFATNKKGTVYWAVSPITDGSVGAEDLIKPPVYGSISVARGSVTVPKADEEVRAAVTGLTPGGSYYLSAVMVDERNVQSPVKVISFTTPDNTVPAFAQGYPHMSATSAQNGCLVVVMPTKSCNLYYALLPEGSQAPTEDEFKTNAVSGNLGYGMVPVTKNTESVIRVDDVTLEEQKTYVLYLWLVDANGANKSSITSLTFTTDDETPPYFIVNPTPNTIQANSVSLNFRLSETGTVYWAVVPVGTEYPKKQPGHDSINLSDQWAKLQVQNGYSSMAHGQVSATTEQDGTITVSGLQPETAYELYYVAIDTAGNYSVMVQQMTINTLDQTGPKISQYFTRYSGLDNTTNPMVDTGIILRITENVRANVDGAGEDLLSLYQASIDATSSAISRKEALDKLVLSLRNTLVLNQVTTGTGRGSRPVPVKGDTGVDNNWVIDYEKATVALKDGGLEITFPPEALQLDSGSTYYFTATRLTDTSSAQNPVTPDPIDFYTNAEVGMAAGHDLRLFTIMLGQLYMTRIGLNTDGENSELPVKPGSWTAGDGKDNPANADDENLIPVDYSFRVIPQSTSKMDDNMCYDLVFYTDAVIDFDLYYRVVKANADGSTTPVDLSNSANSRYQMPNWATRAQPAGTAGWYKLGTSGSGILRGNTSSQAGVTLGTQFNGCSQSNFPKLNLLDDSGETYYEFAVSITQKDTSRVRGEWSGEVNLSVYGAAAPSTNLSTLTAHPTFAMWDNAAEGTPATNASFLGKGLSNGGGVSIGVTDTGTTFLRMAWPFTDNRVPSFSTESGFPKITPGDTFANLSLALNRAGTIDYVIAPRSGGINMTVVNQSTGDNFQPDELWQHTPLSGEGIQPGVTSRDPKEPADIVSPEALSIAEHLFPQYKQGRVEYDGNNATVDVNVDGLTPDTDYYVYFVTSGVSTELSKIFMYKFRTNPISKPKIQLTPQGSGDMQMRTDVASNGFYRVLTEANAKDANMIQLLTRPFANDANAGLPSAYSSFTVLDALSKVYNYNEARRGNTNSAVYYPGTSAANGEADPTYERGYSVFDIYADDELRARVDSLIRTGDPGSGDSVSPELDWGAFGPTTTPANWGEHLLEINGRMVAGTRYVVLTLAQNVNADTNNSDYLIDSFQASVAQKMNLVPPNVSQPIAIDGLNTGTAIGTYSGKIQIRFNSDTYVMDGTTRRSISEGRNLILPAETTPAGITLSGADSRSFTLTYTNVRPGVNLVIPPKTFCGSNSDIATETLQIALREENSRVFWEVTWGPDDDGNDYQQWTSIGPIDVNTQGAYVVSFANTGNIGTWSGSPTAHYTLGLGDGQNGTTITGTLQPTPPSNIIVEWESSDPSVATVANGSQTSDTFTGTLAVHGIGTTKIIAHVTLGTAGSVSQEVNVTVTGDITLDALISDTTSGISNWNPTTETLTLAGGTSATMTYEPAIATRPISQNLKPQWSSSTPSIASVNRDTGVITAGASDGRTTITLTLGPVTKTFTVQVMRTRSDSGLEVSKLQVLPKY